jgi:hypothetical protein
MYETRVYDKETNENTNMEGVHLPGMAKRSCQLDSALEVEQGERGT